MKLPNQRNIVLGDIFVSADEEYVKQIAAYLHIVLEVFTYMKKLFLILSFFGLSISLNADIIDFLPKTFNDRIDLIDPKIEEAKERAKNDSFLATWLYFLGGDEFYYTGSLFLDNNELQLEYFPPGKEGYFENGASIMAYIINTDFIELILKRWTWNYINDESDKKEKDIVYYHIVLTENNGKIDYACSYIEPTLDLNNYKINTSIVVDENVYAYSNPSFKSQRIYKLEKGKNIKILPTILSENGPEEEPYDFWYKIELENNEAWVYGYYINFSNKITDFTSDQLHRLK